MNALILVDLQNDFTPSGALPVPEGDSIVPLINQLQQKFDLVVATQDWHPADHQSFAIQHEGRQPGELIDPWIRVRSKEFSAKDKIHALTAIAASLITTTRAVREWESIYGSKG